MPIASWFFFFDNSIEEFKQPKGFVMHQKLIAENRQPKIISRLTAKRHSIPKPSPFGTPIDSSYYRIEPERKKCSTLQPT